MKRSQSEIRQDKWKDRTTIQDMNPILNTDSVAKETVESLKISNGLFKKANEELKQRVLDLTLENNHMKRILEKRKCERCGGVIDWKQNGKKEIYRHRSINSIGG